MVLTETLAATAAQIIPVFMFALVLEARHYGDRLGDSMRRLVDRVVTDGPRMPTPVEYLRTFRPHLMWSVVTIAGTVNAAAMVTCLTALSFSPVSPANLPYGLGSSFGARAVTGVLGFDILLLVAVPMVISVFRPMRRMRTYLDDGTADEGPPSRSG
jgi:hypothetical protein